MLLATTTYGCSYLVRRTGRHRTGVGLALAAGAITTIGDYVGGYLALGRGTASRVTSDEGRPGAASTDGSRNALQRVAERAAEASSLDPLVRSVGWGAGGLVRPGGLKNVLTGSWLGHSLHPLLTDLPLASWMSASLLDVVRPKGRDVASERLIEFGLLAALPTALAGMAEWIDSDRSARRVGFVHAGANATAWSMYAASLLARRHLRPRLGIALGLSGAAAMTTGGYLGHHLSLVGGIGVSSAYRLELPDDWAPTGILDELPPEGMVRTSVGDSSILIAEDGRRLHALGARCTHRGGPLDEGVREGGCVTCPWHGSRFRLDDGSVVRGPAAVPETTGEARRRDGWIEVRRRR